MKDGVIIINTSRGPLIVEEGLAEALNSGKVYAAVFDIVSSEQLRMLAPYSPLRTILSRRIFAWAPKESRSRLMDIAVDNLAKFLDNILVNIVNK